MELESDFTQNFCCVKCRNRRAATRTATLSSGLAHILTPGSDKYLLVTCTLCGYTEIFDLKVYAENQTVVPDPKSVPGTVRD